MFKYNFILFVRNLRRQRLFSFINILGLSVGMASALLMYLFISNEFSYDRFHKNADRIYRINQTFIWGEGNDHQFASTGPGVAYALEAELPEVEQVVRIHTPGDFLISYTNAKNEVTSIDQGKVLAADSNFFRVFTFPMIKGNPLTALKNPQTLVMTESTAKKYFGQDDPLGKIIRLGKDNRQQNYEVTGVVRDIPDNSYIQFDVMLSAAEYPQMRQQWNWIWTQVETFVLFKPGFSLPQIQERLKSIPRKYAATMLERVMNISFDDYIKSGKKWDLFVQPLTGIHLPQEPVYNRLSDPGSRVAIYALIGAGIAMVLLSCINFINLSTAQYSRKGKETSVRKILGSARMQLSMSFFTEAFLFCLIGLIVGICLTQIILPVFNLAAGKNLSLDLFANWRLLIALIALLLLMSLLSGIYPSVFLSAFSPVEAMKGKFKTGKEGKFFRNGMVVFQFSISMALIIFTAIVSQQLTYSTEKSLGFARENLLVIKRAEWAKAPEALAHAVTQAPGVLSASWCTSVPPNVFGGDKFRTEGNDKNVALNFTEADESYLSTLGVKMKVGRNFSKQSPADSLRVILNERAVKALGWTADESVIGKKIVYPGGNDQAFEVVGVTDDFHYWSILAPIEPMAIFHIKAKGITGGAKSEYIVLRVQPQSSEAWQSTFNSLQKTWKDFAGTYPFQYSFVEQDFAYSFKSIDQFSKSLSVLSFLAILIASLGLLGMIIYTLEQRTKEIGIRKISGASVFNIMVLISREYTKLIGVAFLVSAPLAYWGMQQWLQSFEYRIVPSPLVFILSGAATLAVAFVITCYHSLKAAMQNPVEVLKDE